MIELDTSLSQRKSELLEYFRVKAAEALADLHKQYGPDPNQRPREKLASEINKAVTLTRNSLLAALLQRADKEAWTRQDLLKCILTITYASYVVMVEFRHLVWPYEYMAFARRMGELWEAYCKICFEYPLRDLNIYDPPPFDEFRRKLQDDIEQFVLSLPITAEQKKELRDDYAKVWTLVMSGEINLELDIHFEQMGQRMHVDFKSGFGSNEKGNTNRLLLVATIYKMMDKDNRCVLLVRSPEDSTNHYFQTLKRSQVWEAYCGEAAYEKIHEFTGFDIQQWIKDNVSWERDLNSSVVAHLRENHLEQYLRW